MHSQVTTHCDASSVALLVDCVCTCMWVTMDKLTSGWVNVYICADVWNLDVWKDGMLMRSDACEMDEEMSMDMYV